MAVASGWAFLSLLGPSTGPQRGAAPESPQDCFLWDPMAPRAARLLRAHRVEFSTFCSAGTNGFAHLAIVSISSPRVPTRSSRLGSREQHAGWPVAGVEGRIAGIAGIEGVRCWRCWHRGGALLT